MNTKIKNKILWTLLSLFSVIPLLIFTSPQTPKKAATIPKADAIEKELFNLINKERRLYNLPLLEISSALSNMARKHSLDMANQGESEPSHLSSNGKTLIHRLEDAGLFFIDAGENVAFSQTFVAEFIHESFIESTDHRETILDPNYTQLGIGVIHLENKGYYVTQDFLRPLLFKTDKQISQIILDRINTERHIMSLPSLDLWQEAEQFDFPEAVNPRYNTGALGIWFGKNRDYPGGVYALALLLFVENSLHTLSLEEQKDFVLKLVNKIRTQFGLKIFTLDKGLTQAAERMASKAAKKRNEMAIFPENRNYGTFIISLTFE